MGSISKTQVRIETLRTSARWGESWCLGKYELKGANHTGGDSARRVFVRTFSQTGEEGARGGLQSRCVERQNRKNKSKTSGWKPRMGKSSKTVEWRKTITPLQTPEEKS